MKGPTSILMLLIFAGLIAPFILPLKDGEPIIKPSDISLPQTPDIKIPNIGSIGGSSSETTFYYWVNEQGHKQVSNIPPPEGVEYETKVVDGNANLIKAPKSAVSSQSEPTKKDVTTGSKSVPFLTADPEKIMDDVNKLEQIIKVRSEQY